MHAISVIISNFNGAKYLPRLIETLHDQRGVELQIIVVDRHSSDDSAAILAAHTDIEVLSHPPETGLVSGYHAGTALARHDLFFFMNEDMWLEPDCLRLVAEAIDESNKISASMPVQWTYDGQDIVNAGIWFQASRWSKYVHPFRCTNWRLPRNTTIVPAVNAGACLYTRSIYEELGGWDITFFLDFEDGDLAIRMWQHGYYGVVVPAARIFHAVGASNSQTIQNGRQTVSRKRYIEGGSNIVALGVKTFGGLAVLYPFLSVLDRLGRNLFKLRIRRAWWDLLIVYHSLLRLPDLLAFRSRNSTLNQKFPGQDYFTSAEFDISVLDGNHQEIQPAIPLPKATKCYTV